MNEISEDGYWQSIDGEWVPTEKQLEAINNGAITHDNVIVNQGGRGSIPLHFEQQMPDSRHSAPMGTIADGQFYAQTWVVQPLKPPQNALINASYTCSVVGLIMFGIILGPIGFILGLVAKLNGDERGVKAMAMGSVVTVLSAIILVWLIKSGI